MTPAKPIKHNRSAAVMDIVHGQEGVEVCLSGRLDRDTAGPVWRKTLRLLAQRRPKPIRIDAAHLDYADGVGIALLAYFKHYGQTQQVSVEITHLAAPLESLLQRYLQHSSERVAVPPAALHWIERIGLLTANLIGDIFAQIAFLGQLTLAAMHTLVHPGRFRGRVFFRMCELAGADAIGITGLLGFLFGLIMAFSSAMPLRQFGVEVYVSDLVAVALVRVLGPFITAIIVAGRTSSAFAAEIGTMKINNELDALQVMNLEPAVFLVLPRVAATLLMTPLLAVVTNVLGLVGSGLVILSLGYPLITYTTHVQNILTGSDVAVGLVKSLVFGGMIGTVGCLRGLQAQSGPGAVGIATTRAVVTAIVLLVMLEGLFSVILHSLGLWSCQGNNCTLTAWSSRSICAHRPCLAGPGLSSVVGPI